MEARQTKNDARVLRLRRSDEREIQDLGWSQNWLTFSFADYLDPDWMRFGPLRVLIESHIQARSGFSRHAHRDVEIVSYVVSGVLTHSDSSGSTADVTPGEVQLISAGSRGMLHSEENRQEKPERHYQLWLIPERRGTSFAYHQLKRTPEERRGQFKLYVSPDGERGSMPVNTDAYLYAGLFSPSDTARHDLAAGRGAWIQVVRGRLRVAGVTLNAGDGAGITGVECLDFWFEEDSEVLLVDVRMNAPLIWR